ncbi:MAG: sensor histidine kinase [Akkermansiaceae bacterium]
MSWFKLCSLGLILASFTTSYLPANEEATLLSKSARWLSPELRKLRAEIDTIDTKLSKLPLPKATNSSHRAGYESTQAKEGEKLWIELAFKVPTLAEQIILIPAVPTDAVFRASGYGFPRRFRLEIFEANGKSEILLDETKARFPNPGIFPVVVNCKVATKIKRLRLTVFEPWESDGYRVLSLAEIMVISGNRNVAPLAEVKTKNSQENLPYWSQKNLIDNFTPLGLPILPDNSKMLGWHSLDGTEKNEQKNVTVDLGEEMPIDEIRLMPAWQENTFGRNNYGLPARFIIEAASKPDFTDAWTVYDRTKVSLQTPGQNIQFYSGSGKSARYVRVTSTRMRQRMGRFVFALGELQVYSDGKNRALHSKVIADESIETTIWGRSALTDDRVAGGKIVGFQNWFSAMDEAQKLIQERKKITKAEKLLASKTERAIFQGSLAASFLTALLATGLVIRARKQLIRDRETHRERLARNLHDELGSNLGSIALISSFSSEEDSKPEQMRSDLITIEKVARESVDSMRELVGLLGSRKRTGNNHWLKILREMAERILRDIEVDYQFPSTHLTSEPNLETCREIYLFCKELMYNCVRHSQATHVLFEVRQTRKGLCIIVSDNGIGFDPTTAKTGNGLGNLRERANILKANLSLESSSNAGTAVTLDVPKSRRWTRKASSK